MEIDRVWAVYFSATDTTKKIVTVLAGEAARTLRAEYCEYDFTLPAARKDLLVFGPRDLVIWDTGICGQSAQCSAWLSAGASQGQSCLCGAGYGLRQQKL